MNLGLEGLRAVVTGGSSGIGLATVKLLLGDGCRVALCGRDAARLDRAAAPLRQQYGGAVLAHPCDVLDKAAVPSSRIYTAADIFEDPHYRAREMIQKFSLPDGQPIDLPGIVPKLSETPGETKWLGPALGEHTDAVLAGLGISNEAIAALRARGVI